MGGALSNPIDAEKEAKIKGIIKDVAETFSTKYAKAYGTALYGKMKEDTAPEGGDDEPKFQLAKRSSAPEDQPSEPLMTGWLTKEGAIRKSWKKRFFVVRPDYKTDYYADEEAYKSKKAPKGTISPAGCKIVKNPESELAGRLQKTAEKLKIDVSELGKPKTFPPNTFGIMHDVRRDFFITAENEEDLKKWMDMFAYCAQRACGLNDQEEVAKSAYETAFSATLEKAGYYDDWNFNGTEDENLSDVITRKLKDEVLDDVFAGLDAPVKIKTMVKEQIEKAVDTTVGTTVSATWSAASKSASATRQPLQKNLEGTVQKITETENKLCDEIKSKISGVVDPAVSKTVTPASKNLLAILITPISKAFSELVSVYTKHTDEAATSLAKGESEASVFSKLQRVTALPDTIEAIYKHIDSLAENISTAAEDVPILKEADTVSNLLGTVKDQAATILDRALFTFQKTYKEATKGGADAGKASAEAKDSTLPKVKHDAHLQIISSVTSFIAGAVRPEVSKVVTDPCKELVAPLTDQIPDFAQSFLNIDDLLDKTLDGILENSIKTAVKPAVPSF